MEPKGNQNWAKLVHKSWKIDTKIEAEQKKKIQREVNGHSMFFKSAKPRFALYSSAYFTLSQFSNGDNNSMQKVT